MPFYGYTSAETLTHLKTRTHLVLVPPNHRDRTDFFFLRKLPLGAHQPRERPNKSGAQNWENQMSTTRASKVAMVMSIFMALAFTATAFVPIADAQAQQYRLTDRVKIRNNPTPGSSYNGIAANRSTITVICQQWGAPQGNNNNTLWLKVNGSSRNGWWVNDAWTSSPHLGADRTVGIPGLPFCNNSTPAPAEDTSSLARDTVEGVTCVAEGGAGFFIPKRYLATSLLGAVCAYLDTDEVNQLLGSGPADRAIGNIAQACGFSGLAGATGFALRNTAGKVLDAFCIGTDIGGVFRLRRPSTIADCYLDCSNWDFVRAVFGFSVGGGDTSGTGQWAAETRTRARQAVTEATAETAASNVNALKLGLQGCSLGVWLALDGRSLIRRRVCRIWCRWGC